MIKGLDRGKLLYPSDDIVWVALISNIVINQTSFDEFVKYFFNVHFLFIYLSQTQKRPYMHSHAKKKKKKEKEISTLKDAQ